MAHNILFDEAKLRRHRQRHAATSHFLMDFMQTQLLERLNVFTRGQETDAVAVFGFHNHLRAHLPCERWQHIAQEDAVGSRLAGFLTEASGESVFDLVIDSGIFHWLNDPIAYVHEVQRCLSQNGIYASAFVGGETLKHLRQQLVQCDLALFGGADLRISPMITPEAMTRLVQSAGLQECIVDHELVTLCYPDLRRAHQDLRFLGAQDAFKSPPQHALGRRHREVMISSLWNAATHRLEAPIDVLFTVARRKSGASKVT